MKSKNLPYFIILVLSQLFKELRPKGIRLIAEPRICSQTVKILTCWLTFTMSPVKRDSARIDSKNSFKNATKRSLLTVSSKTLYITLMPSSLTWTLVCFAILQKASPTKMNRYLNKQFTLFYQSLKKFVFKVLDISSTGLNYGKISEHDLFKLMKSTSPAIQFQHVFQQNPGSLIKVVT